MLKQAAAGAVGLGLIGGVGAVAYDDKGNATVTVTEENGKKHSVTLGGPGGKKFSCPDGTDAILEPIDIRAGRAKITLNQVKKRIGRIEKRYPSGQAPDKVVDRYNKLVKRHGGLVKVYNSAIDEHNAVLDQECEAA